MFVTPSNQKVIISVFMFPSFLLLSPDVRDTGGLPVLTRYRTLYLSKLLQFHHGT